MIVTSPANPRVKAVVKLRNRRERDATGLFVIEGFRELTRAVDAGIDLVDVYTCPELYLGSNEDVLLARVTAPRTEFNAEAFAKMSYRDRPEGLLAVAKQFDTSLASLERAISRCSSTTGVDQQREKGSAVLLLVVESIEKPGNLGTMIRTASGSGATAVVVCDPATDAFNPNVVRASLGLLFDVPLAVTTTPEAIEWLRANAITSVAATPAATTPHWEHDFRGATAIVIGSEQYGLSDAWLQQADAKVVIPMPGAADSLNAAMAAGVLLFEALRQRA